MATQNAINAGVVAGGGQTYTFPAATDTLVGRASTDTLTNKTIDGVTPTVMGYVDPTSSIQTQLNAKAATNADTTGKSAKTDALNSATTVVNVASATAPSTNQVLTATDSTHATWQAAQAGQITTSTTSNITGLLGANGSNVISVAYNATPTANNIPVLDASALLPTAAISKAIGSDVTTGTDANKAVTSKALADANVLKSSVNAYGTLASNATTGTIFTLAAETTYLITARGGGGAHGSSTVIITYQDSADKGVIQLQNSGFAWNGTFAIDNSGNVTFTNTSGSSSAILAFTFIKIGNTV